MSASKRSQVENKPQAEVKKAPILTAADKIELRADRYADRAEHYRKWGSIALLGATASGIVALANVLDTNPSDANVGRDIAIVAGGLGLIVLPAASAREFSQAADESRQDAALRGALAAHELASVTSIEMLNPAQQVVIPPLERRKTGEY